MRLLVPLCFVLLYAAPAAAFCRAGAETEPLGACTEEPSVPRLRWTRGCIEYAFGRRVFDRLSGASEEEVRADFEAAFAAWADTDCGRVPFEVRQAESTSSTQRHGFAWDMKNESSVLAYTEDEWRGLEYDPDAAAATLLFFDPDTGEIYDADIVLNTGAGVFARCAGQCIQGEIDLLNTITHEAGHYLGLGHSTAEGATMAPYGQKSETEKRTLEADDRDGYCALDLPEPQDDACTTPIFYEFEPGPPVESDDASCSIRRPAGSAPWKLALLLPALLFVRRRHARRRR